MAGTLLPPRGVRGYIAPPPTPPTLFPLARKHACQAVSCCETAMPARARNGHPSRIGPTESMGIGVSMGMGLSTAVVPTLPLSGRQHPNPECFSLSSSCRSPCQYPTLFSNQDWVECGPLKYIAVTLASMLFLLISRFHPAATRTAKGMAIYSLYLPCARHQAEQFVPHVTTGQVGCLQARPAPPIRGPGPGIPACRSIRSVTQTKS